jgi:hypothetical protein
MIVVISDIGLSLAIIVAGYVQYDLFEYTHNLKTQVLFYSFSNSCPIRAFLVACSYQEFGMVGLRS